jgi:hypothetical protein
MSGVEVRFRDVTLKSLPARHESTMRIDGAFISDQPQSFLLTTAADTRVCGPSGTGRSPGPGSRAARLTFDLSATGLSAGGTLKYAEACEGNTGGQACLIRRSCSG